ncbi:MAG: hypothetical protein AVDCRST_MAG05-1224, partial [uncultured Rubrobacteraceae bacterium]
CKTVTGASPSCCRKSPKGAIHQSVWKGRSPNLGLMGALR